jgi:hypothetical protein
LIVSTLEFWENFMRYLFLLFFIPGMAAGAGGKVPDMSMILTAKHTHEVKIAPGKTNLYLAGEGAAKLSLDGHTVFVHASCGAVDTIVEGHHSVYAGVGDCEFKSPSGGELFGAFKTPEGKGDRGFFLMSNGTKDLARFSGSAIPMIAKLNPRMVGEMVFYFEFASDEEMTD